MNFKEIEYVSKLRETGKTPMEIATITGISYNTIKSYFRRHKEIIPKFPICKNCGKTLQFTKGKKNKKFCSDACRNHYWNTHMDEVNKKAYYHLTCKYCGKEFVSYGNKSRKFCSRNCYRLSLRKISEE